MTNSLIACTDCDLLHQIQPLKNGQKAKCTRCGNVLYRENKHGFEVTLTLTVTALILFILANSFPFMTLQFGGREQISTISSGVVELYERNMWGLSLVVLLTSIVIPLTKILCLLYVLIPLRNNRHPWGLAPVFRFLETLTPWSMIEIYMLGVLVAVVKLASMATIVPGIALYSFASLILVMTTADATLESRAIWEQIGMKQ